MQSLFHIGLQDCIWQYRDSVWQGFRVHKWEFSGDVWEPTPTRPQIYKAIQQVYDTFKDTESLAYDFIEEICGFQGLSIAWDTQTTGLFSRWYEADPFDVNFIRGNSILEVESRLKFQSPEYDDGVYHFYVIWEGDPFPNAGNNFVALELLIGPAVQRHSEDSYGWGCDGYPMEDCLKYP